MFSPSFAAPGKWPAVYELGLKRLSELFNLVPVEYSATCKLGATALERTADLVAAFSDPEIKAVIASIGGDDQVTYIKNLSPEVFLQNPKPFFGYSDNSHFCNFLFLNGIPSYYGGSLFTQYAMQGEMDEYTVKFLKQALFTSGEIEIVPSTTYNDQGLSWNDESALTMKRQHWDNPGFVWDGTNNATGILWGGCLESLDEMLRHNVPIPSLEQFKDIILIIESSEELPSADYVYRIMRAFGERGILKCLKGILVGRAKSWEFHNQKTFEEKEQYRQDQQACILRAVRQYNDEIPVVFNLNFGHTDPQIPMPYGGKVRIDVKEKKIWAFF